MSRGVGDELEVRGPLTEYFTWEGSSPLLLTARVRIVP